MSGTAGVLAAAGAAFAVVLALGPTTIGVLRHLKAGKTVRVEGPRSHSVKAGTPTMGGLLIVLAAVATTLALAPDPLALTIPLAIFVGFALLGLADDLRGLLARRAMGMRAREKLAGQVVLGLLLGLYAASRAQGPLELAVPFTGAALVLPALPFLLLVTLAAVASANAVNLTDGLDGLAAGSTAVALGAFAALALRLGQPQVALFSGAVAGAAAGFAWFNAHPAQVFMGDTGSLSLGAALAISATLSGTLLFLPLIGGLFAIETFSVILQVLYFKATGGRRIFRMSPLHHHFELSGWAEPQVVTRFWLIALVFAALGVLALPGA